MPQPHYYSINLEIDSDWGAFTVGTPGVLIVITNGQDNKTQLSVDGTKLQWGGFGSETFGIASFSLHLKSDNPLQNLSGFTEHGWDSKTLHDGRGQITITTASDMAVYQHRQESIDPSDYEEFNFKLGDNLLEL